MMFKIFKKQTAETSSSIKENIRLFLQDTEMMIVTKNMSK